jgi:hypothetical protein
MVRNLPGKNQFLLEAPENLGVGRHIGTNHLDGHLAFQLLVVGLIDGAHPALPQQSDDFIAAANRCTRTQLN